MLNRNRLKIFDFRSINISLPKKKAFADFIIFSGANPSNIDPRKRSSDFGSIGQSRKGGNHPIIESSNCFRILRGSIFRTDLVIKLKGGQNSFFGTKLSAKAQEISKLHISRTAGCRKLVDQSKLYNLA